jgi:hypothetical protein
MGRWFFRVLPDLVLRISFLFSGDTRTTAELEQSDSVTAFYVKVLRLIQRYLAFTAVRPTFYLVSLTLFAQWVIANVVVWFPFFYLPAIDRAKNMKDNEQAVNFAVKSSNSTIPPRNSTMQFLQIPVFESIKSDPIESIILRVWFAILAVSVLLLIEKVILNVFQMNFQKVRLA